MLEKLSKMSVRQAMIDLVGAPPQHGEQSRWFLQVSKRVQGVSFRTVRSLWHNEINDPEHLAALAIRREATIAKAKREAELLAARFETIAGSMNATDPDFFSADVAALIHASRLLRNVDGA